MSDRQAEPSPLPPDAPPPDSEQAEEHESTFMVQPAQPKDVIALILAVGVATAINIVVLAVMWDAIQVGAEISENGTQIISGVLGGVIGILGSYLGFSTATRRQAEQAEEKAAEKAAEQAAQTPPEPPIPP